MTQTPIPFNNSYHIDEHLRDVPDDPEDMALAVSFLREQLATAADEEPRRNLLGLLGVFQRMLGDLDEAESCLLEAIEVGERTSDAAVVQNRIRLAHAIYRAVVTRCEAEGTLRRYLDLPPALWEEPLRPVEISGNGSDVSARVRCSCCRRQ